MMRDAMDEALSIAERVTFVGSIIPSLIPSKMKS
jgi:hypothetical protein